MNLDFLMWKHFFLSVVTYNEEKEEKAREEKKQRQLEAVELARKLEEEKKNNGIHVLFTFLLVVFRSMEIYVPANIFVMYTVSIIIMNFMSGNVGNEKKKKPVFTCTQPL